MSFLCLERRLVFAPTWHLHCVQLPWANVCGSFEKMSSCQFQNVFSAGSSVTGPFSVWCCSICCLLNSSSFIVDAVLSLFHLRAYPMLSQKLRCMSTLSTRPIFLLYSSTHAGFFRFPPVPCQPCQSLPAQVHASLSCHTTLVPSMCWRENFKLPFFNFFFLAWRLALSVLTHSSKSTGLLALQKIQ